MKTMGPKTALRTPNSQPDHRERTSWFNCVGFGCFLGLGFCAGGFNIPHLCFPESGGFGVPLFSPAWLCSLLFLHTQGDFTIVSLPLPFSGMTSLVSFYIYSRNHETFIFVYRVPCSGDAGAFPSHTYYEKNLIVNTSHTSTVLVFPQGMLTVITPHTSL